MQKRDLRVIHYINQFFGGKGGENKANMGPQVQTGPIGPGREAQRILGERGKIVATVICGDNYFSERLEEATDEVIQMLTPFRPDALIAGPAFHAGRYGIACGSLCKAVQDKLGIPSVTGMYKENPSLDLFRGSIYIVETGDSAKGLSEALSTMIRILCKLADRERIGRSSDEGYFSRGFITHEFSDRTGAERAVSMLLNKLQGKPFKSEVPLPKYDRVKPSPRIKDISSGTIALVTDGGLVPKGNPDKIEIRGATHFGSYSINGVKTLNPEDYEIYHTGYDPIFVTQDPNRLVPVDVMRDLEREGVIGKLHETFYSTSGAVGVLENEIKMGQTLASELKAQGVSGVILTST